MAKKAKPKMPKGKMPQDTGKMTPMMHEMKGGHMMSDSEMGKMMGKGKARPKTKRKGGKKGK